MEDRGFSDLLSTASSYLSSQSQPFAQSSSPSQSSAPAHSSDTQAAAPTTHHSRPSSYGDVMASAQVIMNAAKSKMHKGEAGSGEELDMGMLAGAAGTLIGAASHYGKMDNTSYGKYAQKAEDYLHSYEVKHGKHSVATAGAATHPASAQAAHPSSTPSARQGHSQDHPSQGYGQSAQGSRPAGSQGYSEGHSEPYERKQGYSEGYSEPYGRKQAESEDYPIGYPPAGYPTSDSGPKRNHY